MALDISKMMDFLESEEGKKSLEEYFGGLKKQADESRAYFESGNFIYILNILKNWMIQNQVYMIDGEDFQRGGYWDRKNKKTLEYPISEEMFYKITSSISDSLDANEKIDESIPFSNSYIEYDEFILRYIHGQGTITRLELDILKLRDKNIKTIIYV
jgi:hypothetical protein